VVVTDSRSGRRFGLEALGSPGRLDLSLGLKVKCSEGPKVQSVVTPVLERWQGETEAIPYRSSENYTRNRRQHGRRSGAGCRRPRKGQLGLRGGVASRWRVLHADGRLDHRMHREAEPIWLEAESNRRGRRDGSVGSSRPRRRAAAESNVQANEAEGGWAKRCHGASSLGMQRRSARTLPWPCAVDLVKRARQELASSMQPSSPRPTRLI
jgi:hypothetical protein